MAERPKGFGLTAEIAGKSPSKYDTGLAKEAGEWIQKLTDFIPLGARSEEMQEWLKDGFVLCSLMNAIQPNAIPKFECQKMAFKQMENISKFLQAAVAYGVVVSDLFQTVDLYEGQNMPQVINGIHALSRKASSMGFIGPTIGGNLPNENKREFDDQQLREGQSIIGLQSGSNGGASQQGMTPYGRGRQLPQ